MNTTTGPIDNTTLDAHLIGTGRTYADGTADHGAALADLARRGFRVMDARFGGSCSGCSTAIARGTSIAYGGTGDVWHTNCAATSDAVATGVKRPSRGRSSGGRSTFARIGRNGGRCTHIDYPCCGC